MQTAPLHARRPALPAMIFVGACLLTDQGDAAAQNWKPAHDPESFVTPPVGAKADGRGGEVRLDTDFFARAAAGPKIDVQRATEDVIRVGDVIVVPGDADTITVTGSRLGIDPSALKNITRKAIEFAGDNFEIMTLWLTFDDQGTDALAYAINVHNDVSGLGHRFPRQDLSATYGSQGTLRTVVNMKTVGLSLTDDRNNWLLGLQIWGQETGHRFMAYMDVRDPRSGRPSDLLLGRDCAHFDSFVDTQASVQDGLAWTDNGNGTFTWTDRAVRYGNLDLYGMGLMPADELPAFFLIDDVPNFKRTACTAWTRGRMPSDRTISGTRVDLGIDDLLSANGPRIPSSSSGYVRELQVIVTRPNESVTSETAQGLAQRIDRARLWWEEWARGASNNRLVVCTSSSADCGDARSDVTSVVPVEPAIPSHGPVPFRVELSNAGKRTATDLKAWVEVRVGERSFMSGSPVALADLAPGSSRAEVFNIDLGPLPCGTEVDVLARTQSAFHYNRARASLPLGVKTLWFDGFEAESGWVVNAEGTDDGQGATWERGRPELSFLADHTVQLDAAFAGDNAFVTGLSPVDAGRSGGFVKQGRVTLLSPVIPSAHARSLTLRYHVSFSGMRAVGGGSIEASPNSSLSVFVRGVTAGDAAGFGAWREIDRLANEFAVEWSGRTALIPADIDASEGVQFRFVAADDNPDNLGGVEAAIDDVSLTTTLDACYEADAGVDGATNITTDGGGCGCTVGARRRNPTGYPVVFLFALAVFGKMRRRR